MHDAADVHERDGGGEDPGHGRSDLRHTTSDPPPPLQLPVHMPSPADVRHLLGCDMSELKMFRVRPPANVAVAEFQQPLSFCGRWLEFPRTQTEHHVECFQVVTRFLHPSSEEQLQFVPFPVSDWLCTVLLSGDHDESRMAAACLQLMFSRAVFPKAPFQTFVLMRLFEACLLRIHTQTHMDLTVQKRIVEFLHFLYRFLEMGVSRSKDWLRLPQNIHSLYDFLLVATMVIQQLNVRMHNRSKLKRPQAIQQQQADKETRDQLDSIVVVMAVQNQSHISRGDLFYSSQELQELGESFQAKKAAPPPPSSLASLEMPLAPRPQASTSSTPLPSTTVLSSLHLDALRRIGERESALWQEEQDLASVHDSSSQQSRATPLQSSHATLPLPMTPLSM